MEALMAALVRGAKPAELKGELYAYLLEAGHWYCWKLVLGSPEYRVSKMNCTCPASKPCKHMEGLPCTQ